MDAGAGSLSLSWEFLKFSCKAESSSLSWRCNSSPETSAQRLAARKFGGKRLPERRDAQAMALEKTRKQDVTIVTSACAGRTNSLCRDVLWCEYSKGECNHNECPER
jgi:hypothetical protein